MAKSKHKVLYSQGGTAYHIRQIKEKDSGTLQGDWSPSSDKTESEIREAYESSEDD